MIKIVFIKDDCLVVVRRNGNRNLSLVVLAYGLDENYIVLIVKGGGVWL